jgi:hypothetical protein
MPKVKTKKKTAMAPRPPKRKKKRVEEKVKKKAMAPRPPRKPSTKKA